MSQNFNLNRYRLLFLKNLSENYLKYILFYAGMALVLSILLYISFPMLSNITTIYNSNHKLLKREPDTFLAIFFFRILLQFGGAIFTSTIFAEYGNKQEAIYNITLPATITEKFWVAWTLSVKLFTVIALALFYLILWIIVEIKGETNFHYLNLLSLEGINIISFFLFFQSLYFFGAISFNKQHLIKTTLIIAVFGSLFSYWNAHLLPIIMGRDYLGFTTNGDIIVKNMVIYSRNHRFPLNILKELIFFVLAVIFWTASYFKLKEKEV